MRALKPLVSTRVVAGRTTKGHIFLCVLGWSASWLSGGKTVGRVMDRRDGVGRALSVPLVSVWSSCGVYDRRGLQ